MVDQGKQSIISANIESGKVHTLSSGSIYVKIIVFIMDFLILNGIMWLAFVFFRDLVPPYIDKATRVTILVMNFTMLIAQYFFHTIINRRLLKLKDMLVNVLCLVLLQVSSMGLMLRFLAGSTNSGNLFRFVVIFGAAEFLTIFLSRLIELGLLRYMRANGKNSRSVLFVGNDPALAVLYNRFVESLSVGYRVAGYYADTRMTQEPEGLKYLGTVADLNKRLDELDKNVTEQPKAQELYCSLSHSDEREIYRIIHSCDRNVIRFIYVPRTFEEYDTKLIPVKISNDVFYFHRLEPLQEPGNRLLKRAFDIAFSLTVCICLLPIILVVGIIIKLSSPGPIFFKQARTGLDGNTFYCYKFRSMHVNKDADSVQATEHDPRKFPFGNFMRKTNIDELPQFFNVLKGDMSIVGPRPHMLHHTEMYGKLIDKYMVRLFCKPGITGWAQVNGFRGETKELWQMEDRVKCDIWYVEHWTPWLDLLIIAKTVKSFFVHDKNAY